MRELVALLGTDDWPQGGITAEAELANAVASISGAATPAAASNAQQVMVLKTSTEQPEAHTIKRIATQDCAAAIVSAADAGGSRSLELVADRTDLMEGLTAEIAAAAQKAAQDAISSSVQVCKPGLLLLIPQSACLHVHSDIILTSSKSICEPMACHTGGGRCCEGASHMGRT